MQITSQFKLLPDKSQQEIIIAAMREYISAVNDIVEYAVGQGFMPKLSSSKFKAALPSALKDQCRLDAKSVFKKYKKDGVRPVLKKPVAIWNNQNYKVSSGGISIPVLIGGKSTRIFVPADIPEKFWIDTKDCKLGSLRISMKGDKMIAQVSYTPEELCCRGCLEMGVDLGIKCPAVVETDNKKTRFFGNGRRNRYIRRRYNTRRKKLGKAKKLDAIRKSKNKEQRWMKDQDHKVSRAIVDFALKNDIGLIKLEELSGIRATARTSRKNNRSLNTWSFYRLAQFIEYKANLAGIEVKYVDPRYTSQTCPNCGKRNHAKDREYKCSCGFHCHRDSVGAKNVLAA